MSSAPIPAEELADDVWRQRLESMENADEKEAAAKVVERDLQVSYLTSTHPSFSLI